MTPVPFTELAPMASEVWPSIETDYLACLLSGGYIGGPAVNALWRGWAAWVFFLMRLAQKRLFGDGGVFPAEGGSVL